MGSAKEGLEIDYVYFKVKCAFIASNVCVFCVYRVIRRFTLQCVCVVKGKAVLCIHFHISKQNLLHYLLSLPYKNC